MNFYPKHCYTAYTSCGTLGICFAGDHYFAVMPNGRKVHGRVPQHLGADPVTIVGAIIGACVLLFGAGVEIYNLVQNARAERAAEEAQERVAEINAQIVEVRTETQRLMQEAQTEQAEQSGMGKIVGIGAGIAALLGIGIALT